MGRFVQLEPSRANFSQKTQFVTTLVCLAWSKLWANSTPKIVFFSNLEVAFHVLDGLEYLWVSLIMIIIVEVTKDVSINVESWL